MINRKYQDPFEQIFRDTYDTVHKLETSKLRNVACLFSHLLYTDAISWGVLAHVRLNEEETTSSSRIFIKIMFQELSEYMGLPRLNERIKDPYVPGTGGGREGEGKGREGIEGKGREGRGVMNQGVAVGQWGDEGVC